MNRAQLSHFQIRKKNMKQHWRLYSVDSMFCLYLWLFNTCQRQPLGGHMLLLVHEKGAPITFHVFPSFAQFLRSSDSVSQALAYFLLRWNVYSVLSQCWCGADGCLHHFEYCPGEDALRRGGGHLPDCQNAAHTETGHGADWGKGFSFCFFFSEVLYFCLVLFICRLKAVSV